MSYEIVKSLSWDEKTLSVRITADSNNVYPKSFRPFTYQFKRRADHKSQLTDAEMMMLQLINDVWGGSLKLQKSVSIKVRNAFAKTNAELPKWWETKWPEQDEFSKQYNLAMYENGDPAYCREVLRKFYEHYAEKDTGIKAVIAVGGCYVHRITKRGFTYGWTESSAQVFTSKMKIEEAVADLTRRFADHTFRIENRA